MEILSPAGSIEMFTTAVQHGADAVYLGVDNFSARSKAIGFTLDNLGAHVAYAHKFGVKVYLTLNTLVTDGEISQAVNIARDAYRVGVDAVLIQDMGLADCIAQSVPQLPLHASTQMGIHNAEGAKYIEGKGFKRIVLARETPLKDIIDIKAKTGLEVEVFVHGALCVAFSGNCYYSSLVSANSGNRGRCLQLCRKCYQGVCGSYQKNGVLLSPSDLNLIDRLSDLKEAGVDSIKIEGRMKRPEYAGVVIDAYKKALNGQKLTKQDSAGLLTIFNRGGFTEGYMFGVESDNFVGAALHNHQGVQIGKVISVTPNSLTLRSDRKLGSEDGFKVIRADKEVAGASHAKEIGGDVYRLSKIGDVRIGDSVYMTTDATQLSAVNSVTRKVPLRVNAQLNIGTSAHITACANNHTVEVYGEVELPAARTAPLSDKDIEAAFSRLSDTDYELALLETETNGVFMSKSELNALRRKCVNELDNSFQMNVPIKAKSIVQREPTSNRCPVYYVCHSEETLNDYRDALSEEEMCIYAPENYSQLCIGDNRTYLDMPVIAFKEDVQIFRDQAEILKSYRGLIANNVYALELAREMNLSVIAGFGLNVMNHSWQDVFDDIFYSIENLNENQTVAFGFGEFSLMTFAHCPYKVVSGNGCRSCAYDGELTYTDEMSKQLKVRRTKLAHCYFSLNDCLELPIEERHRRMVVDTRDVTKKEVEKFLNGEVIFKNKNYFAKAIK